MSILNRVQDLISKAHDEVLVCRKWDLKRKDLLLHAGYGRLYPATHRYYFEGNPSFLNDYSGFLDMSRYPIIMLRDGLVTLADFFLKNHRPPESFDTVLLIDARFEAFVPKGWKDFVAFYYMDFPQSKAPANSLILCALAHHFLDAEDPKTSFKRIQMSARGAPQFYVPVRERFMVQNVDETQYVQKGMLSLYEVFGASVHIETDNNRVMDLPLKSGDEVLDLHEDLLFVADNFLHHWFAAKNVQAPRAKIEPPKERIEYPLSLHHQALIFGPSEKLGSSYSELAVNYKLSGISGGPAREEFIKFIQEAIEKSF